jgi:hypothetical protein
VPNWQPPWDDVGFDHPVAHETAAILEATAAQVTAELARRDASARRALEGWRGAHRDSFDLAFAASQRQGHAIADRCRRLAAEVRAAAAEARVEQARRELLRDQWHRERIAEERAAAARAAEARAAEARAADARAAAAGKEAQAPMAW